jgi:PAS domain S-box-containing protein
VAAIAVMAWIRLDLFPDRLLPIGYGVPLCLFLWARDRRLMWISAAAFAVLSYIEIYVVLPRHRTESMWNSSPNLAYVLTIVDLLVIATVVHLLLSFRERWQRANLQLQAINVQLVSREDQIIRQNEALQSQTAELERQSQALHAANAEMLQREKMLEALLDLSRSLHVGLSHDDTMDQICQTLGQLVSGSDTATAILLAEPDGLRVRCQFGFGPAGVQRELIPADRSFSPLVMEQNKTAHLDDLSQRPELEIPQPAEGEPMVSVLAAPLRVGGKAIGTLEIYSRQRRSWGAAQISLVESLAAQTSVSLENAELFDEIDEHRRRLQTMFENVPVGLAVADAALKDIRMNPAGAAMIGVPPDANLAADRGRAWMFYDEGRQIPFDRYPLARAVHGERIFPRELEIVLPIGRRVTILSSAAPFHDAEGRILGAVSSFVDITQFKQLQRELESGRREAEEANVRKTRFLAAASHDIRTPANAISLLAELLKRTADSPSMAAEIPELAAELQASATSLVNLVSNILDVTRFDTDKIELHSTEFPLAQLLEEEIRHAAPLAQDKSISLRLDAAASPPVWLRGDRIKLGRVLGNLLGNAIKFTDEGEVRVTTRRGADGGVSISVVDSGVGISPEHQSRIFDEFFQLSDPQRARGSGLGLAICKRLAQAMGGEITVNSASGKGSTFTVSLPPDAVVTTSDLSATPTARS